MVLARSSLLTDFDLIDRVAFDSFTASSSSPIVAMS